MTGDDHRRWRERLGAYVLDQLPADEAVAVLAHLDGCASCRAEEVELAEVATALAAADPDGLGAAPPAASWLADRVVEAVAAERAERTRRRRRSLIATGLAAAVVAGLVAVGLLTTGSGGSEPSSVPLAFAVVPGGVDATGAVEGKPWGTAVHLEATGLEAGQVYGAWLERADGSRISAGTFRPDEQRAIRCYLTAAIAPDEATAFGVSTSEGRTVLRAALR